MGFVEKTHCKLLVCNGSANSLSTYKMKTSSYSFVLEGGTGRPCLPGFRNLTFFYYIFRKKGRFLSFEKEK